MHDIRPESEVNPNLVYMAGLLKYARQKPSSYRYRALNRSHKFSHIAGDHCANEGFCVEHSAADKPTYSHILT